MVKSLLGILLAILIIPACAHAQYLGSVSPVTVQQVLIASPTGCTGADQYFSVQNLGQGNHYASVDSSGSFVEAQIVGVDIAGQVWPISESAHIYAKGIIAGSGYFPIIRVRVKCTLGASLGISYSGGSSISHINSGAYQVTQIDKALFVATSAAANQSTIILPLPFGNSLGSLSFTYSAATTAGSTLILTCQNTITDTAKAFIFALQQVNTTQHFAVPATPCAKLTVAYTSGGAAVNVFNLGYLFQQPGGQASPPTANTLGAGINDFPILAEKGARWSVTHSPAAAAQATASIAAGAVGVRHVADCVSYSMGAIAAPAATALTLNLRDGATGAGTIIWSKTLPAPATAALHADANFCGLNWMGSGATAMTLEFAAGLANEFESVSLTGYDVQ